MSVARCCEREPGGGLAGRIEQLRHLRVAHRAIVLRHGIGRIRGGLGFVDRQAAALPDQRLVDPLHREQHVGGVALGDRVIAAEHRVARKLGPRRCGRSRRIGRAPQARPRYRRRWARWGCPTCCRASGRRRRAGGCWGRRSARRRRPTSMIASAVRRCSRAAVTLPRRRQHVADAGVARDERPPRLGRIGRVRRQLALDRQPLLRERQRVGGLAGRREDVAQAHVGQREVAAHGFVPGSVAGNRFVQRDRLAIAGERARGVAEVGRERAALDVADLDVGGGDLAPEVDAIAGVAGEPVQVFEPLGHDQLARRRRALQLRDRVVEVEQERVGQLPHVAEALLGARALRPRHPRLPGRGDHAGDQHRERDHAGADDGAVAAHELGGAVPPGVLARHHRQPREVAADVLGELVDRGVAPLRLLAQRLEHDVVEIAGELPAQAIDVDGHAAAPLRGLAGLVRRLAGGRRLAGLRRDRSG